MEKRIMLKKGIWGIVIYSDMYRNHQTIVELETLGEVEMMNRISGEFRSKDCDFCVLDYQTDLCEDWFGMSVEDCIEEGCIDGFVKEYFEIVD